MGGLLSGGLPLPEPQFCEAPTILILTMLSSELLLFAANTGKLMGKFL